MKKLEIMEDIKANFKKEIFESLNSGVTGTYDIPNVIFIQPHDSYASKVYVNSKAKLFHEMGLKSEIVTTPEDANDEWLESLIDEYNKKNDFLLVQLPLSNNMNPDLIKKIKNSIDIDRLGDEALAELNCGDPTAIQPCTAGGVLRIVTEWVKTLNDTRSDKFIEKSSKEYNKNSFGDFVITVIGRGPLSGRPISRMFQDMGATVISLNSNTKTDLLVESINRSNIVVSCTGIHGIIKDYMFNDRVRLIVDVGVTRDENGKLAGDLMITTDDENAYGINTVYTPCKGGAGPMTVLSVVNNCRMLLKRDNKL